MSPRRSVPPASPWPRAATPIRREGAARATGPATEESPQ